MNRRSIGWNGRGVGWVCVLAVAGASLASPLRAQQSAAEPAATGAAPDATQPQVAQPAAGAPVDGAAPAAAPGTSRVTFVNSQPGVSMYLVTPKLKVYLCQQECALELRQAPYQVGLAMPGDDVLPAGAPVSVAEGPQVVETAYVSRAAERRAGLLVLGVGAALSVASLVTGIYMTVAADSPTEETVGLASLSGGAAGLAISSVIGLFLAAREDEAHAILRPADR